MDEEQVDVCSAEELPQGSRRIVSVRGRNVAVINWKGRVYAMDNACYHHGGPLLNGDIEDIGNEHPCIVCPWHSYRLSLVTGECYYDAITPTVGGSAPIITKKSKGVKQRVHRAAVVQSRVVLTLNLRGEV